jgi:hypothetical protein
MPTMKTLLSKPPAQRCGALLNPTAAITLLAAFPVVLSAQWPAYPTAGVPRMPDGKPNLQAPAPRTADGKPDLSGIWENFRRGAAQPDAAGQAAGGAPLATFRDIGSGFKEGLPFQPWAADLVKKRREQNSKDNPDAKCLPMGLMQFHNHPQPRKIIQTPGVILMLYEANSGIRQVFTDGRPLPKNDPQPWWYGYSVGKWDGDTLVVETIGLRDDGWLDIIGSPQTESAKLTERFRRPNFGNLEIEITVDDPKAYTKPWTVKVNQRIMVDTELIEFICQENDKSVPHMVGK